MPHHHNIENVTKPTPPLDPGQGERLLNVRQVSELTGMSVDTLNRARIYGTTAPPFCKIGRSCRYKLSSVMNWISSQTEFSSTSAQQAGQ